MTVVDEFQLRVSLTDTDAAGVIYVSSPARWAQVGFENLMRALGHPLEDLLQRDHHYPVVNLTIDHRSPLTLATPITVRTGVTRVGQRSVEVLSLISDQHGSLCCSVKRVCVAKSRTGKDVTAEAWFKENLCQPSELHKSAPLIQGIENSRSR